MIRWSLKTCLFAVALLIMLLPISSQAETERVAAMEDWAVFRSENPSECWAASNPTTSEVYRDGKIVSVRRGLIQLFTTYKPSKGISGQISFTGGYSLAPGKKLSVQVGSKSFKLNTNGGEWAWPLNKSVDAKIRSAFQEGQSVTITAQSQKGTVTKDSFSLMGFTAANREAARQCGLITATPKKVFPKVAKDSCDEKISLCTISELCSKASKNQAGVKVWRKNNASQKFVNAAKNLELVCGVKVQATKPKVVAVPKPITDKEAELFIKIKKDFGLNYYGGFIHTDRLPNTLFFFSDIRKQDSFQFRKALRVHDIDLIVLSSPGGSVNEGLQTAGIIHDKSLKTYIPKQSLYGSGNCASACSFMFFAGESRSAEGNLGVHQFYSGKASDEEKIGATQKLAQFTVSEIIGFLNEFETPPWVFERMFQQKEMYYFTESELLQLETEVSEETTAQYEKAEKFISDFRSAFVKIKD
ncbi:hypothetical protein OAC90_01160 [Planktomarina sp.]|nr:hypothetical protein [Planktomarina sp.]